MTAGQGQYGSQCLNGKQDECSSFLGSLFSWIDCLGGNVATGARARLAGRASGCGAFIGGKGRVRLVSEVEW